MSIILDPETARMVLGCVIVAMACATFLAYTWMAKQPALVRRAKEMQDEEAARGAA